MVNQKQKIPNQTKIHKKKESGTLLNVSSVTSLPKLDTKKEMSKHKRASVDEIKGDIRRTSQRVKSIDRGIEQS